VGSGVTISHENLTLAEQQVRDAQWRAYRAGVAPTILTPGQKAATF
jgi:hypothetical protein